MSLYVLEAPLRYRGKPEQNQNENVTKSSGAVHVLGQCVCTCEDQHQRNWFRTIFLFFQLEVSVSVGDRVPVLILSICPLNVTRAYHFVRISKVRWPISNCSVRNYLGNEGDMKRASEQSNWRITNTRTDFTIGTRL